MDLSGCRNGAGTDPLILALEAWQFISLRTRHCLELYAGDDPAATIAWVPIEEMRLSHLTRWTARDLLSLPNFGRSSLCEVALAMERYGLRLKGDDGLCLRDPHASLDVARVVPNIAKKMETQRAALDRKVAIVRLSDKDGLTLKEIAGMYGVSVGRISEIIKQTQPIVMQRERYPLDEVTPA